MPHSQYGCSLDRFGSVTLAVLHHKRTDSTEPQAKEKEKLIQVQIQVQIVSKMLE
jgi:hypothetical protein